MFKKQTKFCSYFVKGYCGYSLPLRIALELISLAYNNGFDVFKKNLFVSNICTIITKKKNESGKLLMTFSKYQFPFFTYVIRFLSN